MKYDKFKSEEVKRKFYEFGDDLLNGKGSFTVPQDYSHDTQIETFRKKPRRLDSQYYYGDELTSENFLKTTNKLIPGKTYAIKMFPILETVKSEDCLAFLASNNAILVNVQGLTALQDDQPEIFPLGKCIASLDEKDALYEDADGVHRVPFLFLNSRESAEKFYFGYFDGSWGFGDVLICFCDLDRSFAA